MKTWKIAAISAFVVLAFAAAGAGYAFAQETTPPWGGGGYGGMMGGGYGGMTPALVPGASVGGFAQDGDGYAWMQTMRAWMGASGGMHTLVWDGLAGALGLTPDELQAELAAGKTLPQIAEAQGVSQDELAAALEASVTAGLEKAVADGALTQEQADWMLSHMGGRFEWMLTHMGTGYGPGGCHNGTFAPAPGSNS